MPEIRPPMEENPVMMSTSSKVIGVVATATTVLYQVSPVTIINTPNITPAARMNRSFLKTSSFSLNPITNSTITIAKPIPRIPIPLIPNICCASCCNVTNPPTSHFVTK